MKELNIEALKENLDTVLQFVDKELEDMDCPIKIQFQIDVAVEEIFINIASYAYEDKTGFAKIEVIVTENPTAVSIKFTDSGVPYDPLKKPDPDVSLSAEERRIGGLGIYMVKKSMDNVYYEYKDGKNVLTMFKKI